MTFEWHEQSIYEFLLHQLVYKPLTGRIWWYGGLSKDPAVREASLPQETVDIQQLKRRSWRSSKRRLSPSAQNTTPSESDEWEELAESPSSDDATDTLSFTWLGQSTCIVQIDGITILTDPVFTDKPIAHWLAPSRLRETPISLQELMEADIIDICIVSHDHFDHASEEAVQQLGNKALWVCPQDLSHFFVSNGVHPSRVIEMTWWDERTVNVPGADVILQLACTPAQHWSGRGLRDVNQSLWAGFIVKSVRTGKSFFHCGDTGYSKGRWFSAQRCRGCRLTVLSLDLYEAVGRIYAPITVAAIPVGSYSPVWYMKNFHTTPKGAVRIHRQLGIQQSVAVHWVSVGNNVKQASQLTTTMIRAHG